MTIDDFLTPIDDTLPPAPQDQLDAFEAHVGHRLPDDYRRFLIACNGGYVGVRSFWFEGLSPDGREVGTGVHHIGGLRQESYYSLFWNRECYEGRIPDALIWIMDDPSGNAICLGVSGEHRGRIYFWDHEDEPDDDWDGRVETAGNVELLANSFAEFVTGVRDEDDN